MRIHSTWDADPKRGVISAHYADSTAWQGDGYPADSLLEWMRDALDVALLAIAIGLAVAVAGPGLILLDVNLPRLSGLEVLAELKQDPELLLIPVVMLTTSQAEEDILRSYRLHANAYVSKPVDFEHFFMTLVQLPG
jgi:CheY-like chemotaxis protein